MYCQDLNKSKSDYIYHYGLNTIGNPFHGHRSSFLFDFELNGFSDPVREGQGPTLRVPRAGTTPPRTPPNRGPPGGEEELLRRGYVRRVPQGQSPGQLYWWAKTFVCEKKLFCFSIFFLWSIISFLYFCTIGYFVFDSFLICHFVF